MLCSSCNGTKQIPNDIALSLLKPSYNLSTRSNQFLHELDYELMKSKKNLDEFTPSKKLIDEYSIKNIGNRYFISGFIKIKDNFNKSSLENNGVILGSTAGKILTVGVPFKYLPDFLNINTIEYFEISEKVHIK